MDSDGEDTLEREEKLALLARLKTEHRQLDEEIAALYEIGVYDMLKIGRMKKLKLKIKEEIVVIENSLMPDIIA